jgi:hypothetical protein
MNNTRSELMLLGLTVFVQLLIMILVPAMVAIDAIYYGGVVDESSATEYAQESLVLLAALLYGWGAYKRPASRGALMLLAGLLGCMFIREQDVVFDQISHGAWVYPAWSLALLSMYGAWRNRGTTLPMVLTLRAQPFFAYLSLGLLILIGFSRLFGTGSLWEAVVPEVNDWRIKTAVQEGLELLGYALVFYSALIFTMQKGGAEKPAA